eukprot:TRINITY_DN6804_c0_g1_i4.p1 TRINITY_DN6804_c0_g1~~TRINITY_DN6804_c0_g1_i4.p1  ORF type:complete len:625 (+),score=189.67 TRINITY_DN6804_c0_g1_i4:46-1920(+)
MSRSKADQEREKVIQERCQILLNRLLKEEDNKYCVDCDAKGPRWASWNIGVFLCIRCAGIHRNLGVHISKVRSVNLDSWTPAQVSSMQCMGNSRGRAVYEASVPDDFKRPNSDGGLEQFIRAKYERKKYIMKDWVATKPPDLPEGWNALIEQEKLGKARDGKLTVPSSSSASTTKSPDTKKLETKPMSNNSSSSAKKTTATALPTTTTTATTASTGGRSTAPAPAPAPAPSVDLLGLSNTQDDDLFSNFVSAPPASSVSSKTSIELSAAVSSAPPQASSTLEQDFFNQVSTPLSSSGTGGVGADLTGAGGSGTGVGGEAAKMSNSSIMALFSSVPQNKGPTMIGSPAAPGAAPLNYPQQQPQQQQSLYPNQQLHAAFQQGVGGQNSPAAFNNNVGTSATNNGSNILAGLMTSSAAAGLMTSSPAAGMMTSSPAAGHMTSSSLGGGSNTTAFPNNQFMTAGGQQTTPAAQNIFQMNNQFSGLQLAAGSGGTGSAVSGQVSGQQWNQNFNQLNSSNVKGLYGASGQQQTNLFSSNTGTGNMLPGGMAGGGGGVPSFNNLYSSGNPGGQNMTSSGGLFGSTAAAASGGIGAAGRPPQAVAGPAAAAGGAAANGGASQFNTLTNSLWN